MGDSIGSATNAISDAARDVSGAARDTYRQTVGDNIRREVGGVTRAANRVGRRIGERPLENALSLATLGVPAMLREGGSMAADALGMGAEQEAPPGAPIEVSDPHEAVYPTMKRKRQIAGRAGTMLTGGGGTGGTLGGAGGRSTLLGM